jgi:hypothetical protein
MPAKRATKLTNAEYAGVRAIGATARSNQPRGIYGSVTMGLYYRKCVTKKPGGCQSGCQLRKIM